MSLFLIHVDENFHFFFSTAMSSVVESTNIPLLLQIFHGKTVTLNSVCHGDFVIDKVQKHRYAVIR